MNTRRVCENLHKPGQKTSRTAWRAGLRVPPQFREGGGGGKRAPRRARRAAHSRRPAPPGPRVTVPHSRDDDVSRERHLRDRPGRLGRGGGRVERPSNRIKVGEGAGPAADPVTRRSPTEDPLPPRPPTPRRDATARRRSRSTFPSSPTSSAPATPSAPGAAVLVRVLDGLAQQELFPPLPLGGFLDGGIASAGDGTDDLLVTPDEGGGPRVTIDRGGGFAAVGYFFGIDDPNIRGGARAAVGDVIRRHRVVGRVRRRPAGVRPPREGTASGSRRGAGERGRRRHRQPRSYGTPPVCGGRRVGSIPVPGSLAGSRPAVWGRREGGADGVRVEPVHPHAWGKGAPAPPPTPASAVHPHVCGEGDAHPRHESSRARFTPTCVGKARACGCPPTPPTVHPHVCGEGMSGWLTLSYADGSPPRVWGRLLQAGEDDRPDRFTPTCVGKAVQQREAGTVHLRFTPTCVGKAACRRRPVPPGSVHPHVCGEGSVKLDTTSDDAGSPPRVWGRHGAGVEDDRLPLVHPHVCGEGALVTVALSKNIGSPPRVWGRRPRPNHRDLPFRFTPTCVGKARTPTLNQSASCGSPPRVWGRLKYLGDGTGCV